MAPIGPAMEPSRPPTRDAPVSRKPLPLPSPSKVAPKPPNPANPSADDRVRLENAPVRELAPAKGALSPAPTVADVMGAANPNPAPKALTADRPPPKAELNELPSPASPKRLTPEPAAPIPTAPACWTKPPLDMPRPANSSACAAPVRPRPPATPATRGTTIGRTSAMVARSASNRAKPSRTKSRNEPIRSRFSVPRNISKTHRRNHVQYRAPRR